MSSVASTAIKGLLANWKNNPYFNVREADYRSELVGAIRARLHSSPVKASLYYLKTNSVKVPLPCNISTSRVHQEARFQSIGPRQSVKNVDEAGRIDIIILKDQLVDLMVSAKGKVKDTQAAYLIDQVEVAIEVKCTPLNSSDIDGVMKDIRKLAELGKRGVKELHFVQINTSAGKTLVAKLPLPVPPLPPLHIGIHGKVIGNIYIWDSLSPSKPNTITF